MATQFRTLDPEEEAELDRFLLHAIELVPIVEDMQEDGFLLVAGHILMESLRAGESLPAGVSKEDLVLWLGTLWGEEICRMGQWQWGYAELTNGFAGIVVVDANKARMCFPFHCVNKWLSPQENNDFMAFFARLCQPAGTQWPANSLTVMG